MSGTIHVNTEQLRNLGNHFAACNAYLREQLVPELQRLSAQTEGQWTGISRQRYDELFHQWNTHAQTLLNSCTDINYLISSTADHFDQADHTR